ncbi:Uncharacterised protein [Mycobacteroides abscessus subsp. abscessus]|nr:Uncharacterised protein [Mycobacteroides abscessus subsp. abscessus]
MLRVALCGKGIGEIGDGELINVRVDDERHRRAAARRSEDVRRSCPMARPVAVTTETRARFLPTCRSAV